MKLKEIVKKIKMRPGRYDDIIKIKLTESWRVAVEVLAGLWDDWAHGEVSLVVGMAPRGVAFVEAEWEAEPDMDIDNWMKRHEPYDCRWAGRNDIGQTKLHPRIGDESYDIIEVQFEIY